MTDIGRYHNPRLAEAIRRAYGEELQIDTFSPEIVAGVLLENDRFENRLLQGLRYWSTGEIIVAANPGNVSRLQIHNPAGSGQIVVVEGFVVWNPLVGGYIVTRDGALSAAPTQNLATDLRVPISAGDRKVASLNRIDNVLPAPSGVKIARRTAVAGVDVIFNFLEGGPEEPIVLVPNTVCDLVNGTVNQALSCYGFGYDRPARPEELVLT